MKTLLITVVFIAFSLPPFAEAFQTDPSSENSITIQSFAEVHIPADLILFHVNITQYRSEAREAFREHKKQEEFLTSLLIDEGVEEKHITANPISISTTRRHNEGTGYETRQQVRIQLDDVTQFESMQMVLIENGFVNFSGNFSASDFSAAQDEALKKAVTEARRKADLLADAAGLEVLEVMHIEYGSRGDYSPGLRDVSMAFEAGSGSLLQFEHTIPVRENVRIVYRTGN